MLARHLRPSRRHPDRGASAVEFALILPVFVVIIAAILDFGFIFAQQVSLNNAARDAARAAVVKPTAGQPIDCQAVITMARNGSISMGMNSPTQVGVAVNGPSGLCQAAASAANPANTTRPCTGATPADLSVTVTFTSQVLLPLPYLNTKVLTATGVFQCEYN